MSATTPTQRVRVLWLIKGLGPGGAEQLLLQAARVTDRSRFDYRLAFVRPDKTHLVGEFEAIGLVPERLGATGSGRFGWVGDLRRMLAEVDLVHSHSPVLASVVRLLARTLPRSRRPLVVTTEHNEWTSHRVPTRLANGLTSPLDAYTWAVSDPVRQTVWPWRRHAYHVLIHGIDMQAAATAETTDRSEVRRSLGLTDDHVLGITVANLRSNKDYPNLLRAAKLAVAKEPRLRFIAVGQGPLADEIAALHSELGLGDSLQLLGFRRDIADLMAASDMLVIASQHEGLPVVIMEAFATGLPVVATTVGGIPQAVTDGVEGRLVPPHDHEALARAVVAVARDEDARQAMGEAARRRASDYDIRTAVGVQQDKYLQLVAARKR
ncbi:MAG: glycosyltransferase [Brooklawnia sp.]|jgi:glycosyltransferase involved in cell wall biosynthesis